jgi:hypothetical protein
VKDTIVVDIDAPQDEVAALFADPANNLQWMHDIERYEPVSGAPGAPGSTYRLIPKHGSMVFTATVLSSNLPNELRLRLDASNAAVHVLATLSALPGNRTRLVSDEEFAFKSIVGSIFGVIARRAIRNAHREHIEAFKRFAEERQAPGNESPHLHG